MDVFISVFFLFTVLDEEAQRGGQVQSCHSH